MSRTMNKEELVCELMGVLDDPSDVGMMLRAVESALVLQNDARRPVYIFEASEPPTQEEYEMIDAAFADLGLAAVVLPKSATGKLELAGEVTRESMGIGKEQE